MLADGERWRVIEGDALAVLATLPAASFDAVVTDPPAGIGFMGKEWDKFTAPPPEWAMRKDAEGTVGFANGVGQGRHVRDNRRHRTAFVAFLTAVMVECLRVAKPGAVALAWAIPRTSHWTATACEDAGWLIEDRIAHLFGQGFPKHKSKLKPACEDWWLCRKPGPKWLGVEACRVGTTKRVPGSLSNVSLNGFGEREGRTGQRSDDTGHNPSLGRWPANVALSHSPDCNDECAPDCPVRLLDEQSGKRCGAHGRSGERYERESFYGRWEADQGAISADLGGASRFFYCAKASRTDRGPGNAHPTVKSTALMCWLCRLACPPGGLILDPFAGSGTTLLAALTEGFHAVGIEQSPDYCKTARRRLGDPDALPPAGGLFAGLA